MDHLASAHRLALPRHCRPVANQVRGARPIHRPEPKQPPHAFDSFMHRSENPVSERD
jgi:hypothetical protein